MANIIVPSRRLQRPQKNNNINWHNSVTKGLVSVLSPELRFKDLVNNNWFSWNLNTAEPATSVTKRSVSVGEVIYSSHDYGIFDTIGFNPIATTDNFTVLVWGSEEVRAGNSYSHTLFSRGKDGQGAGRSIRLGTTANTSHYIYYDVISTSPSTVGHGISTNIPFIDKWVLARYIQGTSISLYINGFDPIHNTTSIGSNLRSSTYGIGVFGQEAYPLTSYESRNWFGLVGYIFVWNRALSDRECQYCIDNPWQLFIPNVNRTYFDVPAPQPDPTTPWADQGGYNSMGS